MQQEEAYFISLYLYPTALFDEVGERIDILRELNAAGKTLVKTVYVGKKERIQVRLVAFRLSDSEVEKRIWRIKKKGQQRKRSPVQKTLDMARWSIYITNVAENVLSDEQIHLIYTLRWQIELLFKVCKSEAMIDKLHSQKINRIVCELYAKLISIVNLLYMCFPIRWSGNQELSLQKAYRTWRSKAIDFFRGLESSYRFRLFIEEFIDDLKDFCLKDQYRKKRRLSYQRVMDSSTQTSLSGQGA